MVHADRLISQKEAFQEALLSWYRASARPLPWRRKPSLYKTVVSEFMLQQTQVSTVLPYFARWMDQLPDFEALAASPAEKVLKLWEGLGYYSRARNLHKLAQAVVGQGGPPKTAEGWRELPGIGPYTSAAIASIALGEAVACVDGNVVRILARLTADSTPYRDSGSAAKAHAPLAQALVTRASPGDHNQAMMELGATVCLRQSPLCLACPVRRFCAGCASAAPTDFPKLEAKAFELKEVVRVWCEQGDSLLLHRAKADAKRLANLYELPTAEQAGLTSDRAKAGPLLAIRKRSITRFRITESIHAQGKLPQPLPSDLSWIALADLDQISLSGPHRKWVGELLTARLQSAPSKSSRRRRSPAGSVQG